MSQADPNKAGDALFSPGDEYAKETANAVVEHQFEGVRISISGQDDERNHNYQGRLCPKKSRNNKCKCNQWEEISCQGMDWNHHPGSSEEDDEKGFFKPLGISLLLAI